MSSDPFTEARSGFTKPDDLLGRLLLVTPERSQEKESTLPGQQGKNYTAVFCSVVVLDGKPSDVIEAVPSTLENFMFSGSVVSGQLVGKVGTGGMVLGRLSKQKSQTKGFGDAWVLSTPTEGDKQVARDYLAAKPKADPFD